MVAVTLASGIPAVQAQEQPAAGNPPERTVIATGSYIPQLDGDTPAPVSTITAEDIENSGVSIEDAARALAAERLPTAFASAFAHGAPGTALRGLTADSTLLLIDGLRTAKYALAGAGGPVSVDLNSIPVGAIERIEVLRDSASSVYGTDAIGGVINVILRKQYQGLDAAALVGDSQHGGGFERHMDFTAGHGDLTSDHYNTYLSAEWQTDNRIGVAQRGFPFDDNDYSPFGGANLRPQPGLGSGSIYGSVTPGTLITPGNVLTGVPLPGAVSQPLLRCPAGSPATSDAKGNVFCNQNQTGYLDHQPPTQRFGLSGRMTMQFNLATQAYLEASYHQARSLFPSAPPAQIQANVPNLTTTIALPATVPGPAGSGTQLNPNDPFAALGEVALVNYAFGPLGAETNSVRDHDLRVVGDLSGTWSSWRYDTAFVVSHTWLDYSLIGYLNYNQLVSDVTNGTYNFIDPSANSAAVLGALAPTVTEHDTSDMDAIVLRASRDLARFPGGPMQMALGAEWRYEAEVDRNPNASSQVQGVGFSQAFGSRNIEGLNAELDLPVAAKLDLAVSGRYDHYSDFGNLITPKVRFEFKPLDRLALRGSFSRGFRAPSFAEIGSSEMESFIPGFGFCPSQLCTAHGADGYISSYMLGVRTTANPSVRPEKSTSYTFGIVSQAMGTWRASVDYYYIKTTNLITEPNPSAALAQYATAGTLPPGFSAVYDSTDPLFPAAAPRIVTIAGSYTNTASEYTDGVDFDLSARFDLAAVGQLTSQLAATHILGFVYQQPGMPPLQYAGLQSPYNLSSGAGTPQDRVSWMNAWHKGSVTVSANVYYTGAYKMYGQDLFGIGANSQVRYLCLTTIINGVGNSGNCRTGSFADLLLAGGYQLNAQLQLIGSIDNALDKRPPVNLPSYAGVNYNPAYSQAGIVGRFFRVGVRLVL
jgi:iron complex outermembrane receptor protein